MGEATTLAEREDGDVITVAITLVPLQVSRTISLLLQLLMKL
jgi:hypothetical protein